MPDRPLVSEDRREAEIERQRGPDAADQHAPTDMGEKVAAEIETEPSVLRMGGMKVLFAKRFKGKPRDYPRQDDRPYPTKHFAKLAFDLASGWRLLRCRRAI